MSKFFFIEGDIPSVEFEVLRLKSACYELFTNFIVLYFIVEGLKKKKKRYNNINVSIAKILGLVVKEEGLFFIFFFSFHTSVRKES